jgi:hypothetical protein
MILAAMRGPLLLPDMNRLAPGAMQGAAGRTATAIHRAAAGA